MPLTSKAKYLNIVITKVTNGQSPALMLGFVFLAYTLYLLAKANP